MKKLNVVMIIVVYMLFNVEVYGVTNEINIENSFENIIQNMNGIFDVIQLEDINFISILQEPLELVWIFIKAFLVVVLINLLAKLICKICFNSSSVLVRRIKTRKLDKVLKKLYPDNKSIYD